MKFIVTGLALALFTALASGASFGAAAVNGSTLYSTSCSGCHGPLASSQKAGASASMVQSAISGNIGGMGFLSTLSAADIQAIAGALGTPASQTPAPTGNPAPGPAASPSPATGQAPAVNSNAPSAPAGNGPALGMPSGQEVPPGMSGDCGSCHANMQGGGQGMKKTGKGGGKAKGSGKVEGASGPGGGVKGESEEAEDD